MFCFSCNDFCEESKIIFLSLLGNKRLYVLNTPANVCIGCGKEYLSFNTSDKLELLTEKYGSMIEFKEIDFNIKL